MEDAGDGSRIGFGGVAEPLNGDTLFPIDTALNIYTMLIVGLHSAVLEASIISLIIYERN